METSFIDNYTIVDIETTGLSPVNNEIIELSAIKIRDNKIVEKFSTLVKPTGSINGFITNLTGISNDMVKNAPNITDVLKQFIDFISDDCIIGHNINFDLRFIKHNANIHMKHDVLNPSLDTVKLARKHCPNLSSYKLENLAKYFNIDTTGHHRALKDCEMTYNLYNKLQENSQCKLF